jgi:hypothetical protein
MFIQHYLYCNFCKKENLININVPDRGEYQKQYGNQIGCYCSYCYKKYKISINKVYAKSNGKVLLAIVITSAIIFFIIFLYTFLFSNKFYKASLYIFLFPILFFIHLNNISSNFNKYRIK